MARRSLKDLQSKINNDGGDNNGSSGIFYPHWKLPFDGSTRVRLLEDPDEDNPYAVYIPFMEHKLHIDGKQVRIPCIRNKGKNHNCPICDISQKFYNSDSKKQGKYYYRDLYCMLRGIITRDGLEHPEGEESSTGKVKVLKFSFQILNKLKAEIAKLDDDDLFWDLDEGLDFSIVKDKQMIEGKEMGKYDLSTGFVRKTSSIPEEWREEIPDEPLSALLPEIPSYDEADELLQRHLKELMGKGDSDDNDDGDDEIASEDDLMSKIKRQRNAKKDEASDDSKSDEKEETSKPSVKESDDDDDPLASLQSDDDDDGDSDDILAQLKG